MVLIIVLNQCLANSGTGGGTAGYSTSRLDDSADTGRYDSCETGADANDSQDCARVAVENSLTDYWEARARGEVPARGAAGHVHRLGQHGVRWGHLRGRPVLLPADESIYLDTDFFDEVLERELGGPDGGFVEFYVLAHEYGHHIPNLLGYFGQVRTQQGPQSDAVRLELQADCYAGMWAKHATSTEDAEGEVLISDLTEEDVDLAIEAAEAVGDDRIQQKTQGQVTEESWTHGSAAMRKKWFEIGYTEGSLQACDTFAVDRV